MEHVRSAGYVRVASLSPANAVPMTQDRGNSFNRSAAILFGLTKVEIATRIESLEFVDDQ